MTDQEQYERATAWLKERYPDVLESIDEKVLQLVREEDVDEDQAAAIFWTDRLTHEEQCALSYAYMRARFDERIAERVARPRWRRALSYCRAWVVEQTFRWPRLRCAAGWHLWAPIAETNIVDEHVLTGEEVCEMCERARTVQ